MGIQPPHALVSVAIVIKLCPERIAQIMGRRSEEIEVLVEHLFWRDLLKTLLEPSINLDGFAKLLPFAALVILFQ
ncbi:hypothetical protein [Thermophilibacter provencensis]|uniref:hypothetical protein n=1 Tax=Thermophilibacter provencensis TaxID=1852386 RepID=UPI0023565A57|nr:hypothetical protein [Thermophilibacter provencensis]